MGTREKAPGLGTDEGGGRPWAGAFTVFLQEGQVRKAAGLGLTSSSLSVSSGQRSILSCRDLAHPGVIGVGPRV